ncbi:MAG TPA: hypothetical protein VFM94_10910 [Solirubrobacterales bacterium]|nr:hypothetical protein [Solirubrobacterales bacterium]
MPRLVPFRLGAACVLAFVLLASTAAISAAKVPASLRVVGGGGKVLAEKALKTGTVSVPTSRKATCFGKGTAGSGKAATIKGATALGLLGQAARSTKSLQPLLLTDAFDFGLGICGVGGYRATSKLSWYLKVNHENPELGGDAVKLKAGDEVLWALAAYPYPKELSLTAPFSAHPGEPFQVSVFSYDDKGRKRPAAGATVTGASGPTDAAGHATVTLSEVTTLTARRGKDIPSDSDTVVMCDASGACPIP